ncbi:uncharacterized protein LOC121727922 isoform X2 [Aricia agestis]|nr:uncharacterized protein LOC121727922 isoform X2 [Aricia agestis]
MSNKDTVILNSQAKKVVYNVNLFMTKLAEKELKHCPEDIMERTAIATGVPKKTLSKVIYEFNNPDIIEDKGLEIKTTAKRYNITNTLKANVRNCIFDHFYTTERVVPTVKQLYKKLKEDNLFPGTIKTLKRTLKDLGFTKLRINKNLNVLIEKSKFVLPRIKFCKAIDQCRSEGRSIVYVGVSAIGYVPLNTNSDDSGSQKTKVSSQKIFLGHAISTEGYIPNSQILFQETTRKAFNNTYYRWLLTHVVPNLPPNSVVVINNTVYNNILEDYVITSNSNRSVMEAWLNERNIPFSNTMFKPHLYKLISSHKDHQIQYKVNTIIESAGHEVLRIPEVYSDLDPLSIIFDDISNFVDDNKDSISSYVDFKTLIIEKYGKISSIECKILFAKVKKNEEKYNRIDHLVDDLTDELADQVVEDESRGEFADMMYSDLDDSDCSMDIPIMEVEVKYEALEQEKSDIVVKEEVVEIKYEPDDPLKMS